MRCKTCHYSLAGRGGLTEHRCPECGRSFDPSDRKTFDDSAPLSMEDRIALVILIIMIVAIAVLGWFAMNFGWFRG